MEYQDYLKFILALIFVLGLLGGFSLLIRKLGLAGPILTKTVTKAEARIGIVQAVAVDARRKLVLIRRDDVEHLVLLGHEKDLLVETGIAGDKSLASKPRGVHSEDQHREPTLDSLPSKDNG